MMEHSCVDDYELLCCGISFRKTRQRRESVMTGMDQCASVYRLNKITGLHLMLLILLLLVLGDQWILRYPNNYTDSHEWWFKIWKASQELDV